MISRSDRSSRQMSNVTDPDYYTEVWVHSGSFAKLVEIIHKREQDLNQMVDSNINKNKRTRHVTFDDENWSDGDEGKNTR